MNKYRKGDKITSVQQLFDILNKNDYVYQFDRPKHPGWISSYQFRYVCQQIAKGNLFIAEKNR